jgi:hypothetical protein
MQKSQSRGDYTNEQRLPSILAGAFTLALAFALAVAALYALFFRGRPLSEDPEQWGQFGDFLGGVINPVVGLITVFLVILSISIQRKELAATVDEMKSANASASRAGFEQSLFSWLGNYHSLVQAIKYGEYTGREALDQMYGDNFREELPPLPPDFDETSEESRNDLEFLMLSTTVNYGKVFEAHRSSLDAPLRTLFRLFQWIDEQDFDVRTKWHYAALVRAQLSWGELIHLFYNGLRAPGKKFALLCNKYAILDNLVVGRDPLIDRAATQIARAEKDASQRVGTLPFFRSTAFSSDLAKAVLGFGPKAPS